ncbi:hypothetical protein Patl1_08908 [Pistacia atlantica]|uniref:Uncharacterized protein n=1 Tax=Pistacia atlantica TaxID=434234 RepID=A0ACC1AHG9_9ROSI|nr:hypothetical protein Patl1_08908 [Pistacia atlantica]
MLQWPHVVLVAVSIGVLSILLIMFIWRWCCYKQHKEFIDANQTRPESLQAGIAQLHQSTLHNHLDLDSKRRGSYYVFRRGVPTKPLFNWADHPTLVTDAVENGWSRFGFINYMSSSPSSRSSLLGLCAVGDYGRETKADISWEVCQGSADFMQKIRLNSGLEKVNINNPSMSAASVIRTALPLPGPPLGNSAFPQEAFFEITILHSRDDHESIGKVREGEKIKLIQENSNKNANSESLVHVTSTHNVNKIEELKLAGKDDSKGEAVMLSLGLTAGGSLPLRLPGSYQGSIGFNSNGSMYLDVDSELVHVIHCKSEEFGSPLYPTIAANDVVMVLVNFGQSAFTYAPANAQRTSNPCFIGPLVNSPAAALGYEDSKGALLYGKN